MIIMNDEENHSKILGGKVTTVNPFDAVNDKRRDNQPLTKREQVALAILCIPETDGINYDIPGSFALADKFLKYSRDNNS